MFERNVTILMATLSFWAHLGTSLKSTDFCKAIRNDHNNKLECSQSSALYICNKEICAKNQTVCTEYLGVENKLRDEFAKSFIRLSFLSHKTTQKSNIEIEFQRLKSNIKNCQRPANKWQPSDVCIGERACSKLEKVSFIEKLYGMIKSLALTNCPCHGSHAYKCGVNNNFCSEDKRACDLFRHKNLNPQLTEERRLKGIQKCGN